MLTFNDRLYGEIKFSDTDLRFFQTREMTRLRELSLSAVPDCLTPTSVCATKFEHTLGVAHLMRIADLKISDEDFQDVYLAILAHDLGTPPFSHLSEHFLKQLYGVNHEAHVVEILDGSEFAREVTRQGGSISRICRLVNGEESPLSDLVNGSIDFDNLDNSLRYGFSKGIFPSDIYSPEKLAKSFHSLNGKVYLDEKAITELEGWEICRRKTYDFVYSSANLAGGMMLFRAIGLASRVGEIDRSYFRLSDNQALNYLSDKANPLTRIIVERARRWQFYERVYDNKQTNELARAEHLIQSPDARMELADELAQILNIPPEDICVYIGRDKSFKTIKLPIIAADGTALEVHPSNHLLPIWNSQVYLYPKWVGQMNLGRIKEYMDTKTGLDYVAGF